MPEERELLKRSSAPERCLWHQTCLHWAPDSSSSWRAPSHPFLQPVTACLSPSSPRKHFFAFASVNVSEGQQSSLFCAVATLYWSITAALCLLQTGGREGVSGAGSGGGRGVVAAQQLVSFPGLTYFFKRKWVREAGCLPSDSIFFPLHSPLILTHPHPQPGHCEAWTPPVSSAWFANIFFL